MLKKIIKSSVAIALFGLSTNAFSETLSGNVIVKTAQGRDFNQSMDVSDYERFSMQAVYSDGTPAAHTLTSGSRSTNNFTVDQFHQLYEKEAAVSITIATNALTGHTVTLNGIVFTAGTSFDIGATTAITTQNLSNAINAFEQFIATHGRVNNVNASLIYSSASVKGTGPNSWTAVTSTPTGIVLGGAVFSGGQDNGYIFINGVTLTQGTDWNAATSNALTAENIETAINANSSLSSILVATHPNTTSVVYTTVTANGAVEYPISVSTPGFTLTFNKISGGKASNFAIAGDTITKTSHGLTDGLAVLFTTAGATIGGLTEKTTYYAIRLNDDQYQLATSSDNALAGTEIDITSLPNAGVFTIDPINLVIGLAGFHWQASNDNSNWSNLSVSSINYSAAGNTLWDFSTYNYKYLRLNFVAPTWGGIALTGIFNGRK